MTHRSDGPVLIFAAMAFALSWSYWLTLLALGLRVEPGSGVSHLPGLMGPALAAIFTVGLTEGRAGVTRLLAALRGPLSQPGFAFLVMAAPVALSLAMVFGRVALTNAPAPPVADFLAYPGLPTALHSAAGILVVLVLNGLGEELGWRGYAQDRLAARHGRLAGTLLLALVWAVWHLPLFWLNASMANLVGPMLPGWLFGLGCGAFALADLYLRSGRRLWVVVLWHVAYNLVVATPATEGLPAAAASAFVMVWGIDAARRFHQADRREKAVR